MQEHVQSLPTHFTNAPFWRLPFGFGWLFKLQGSERHICDCHLLKIQVYLIQ